MQARCKTVVILPAYNAEKTLRKTFEEIPLNLVDEIILTDDASTDKTIAVAKELGIHHVILHEKNRGYGANQKTCYDKALERNADIIIMIHPDYQYTPKLLPAMVSLIASGLYPVVLGSRILGNGALRGGMPRYKYVCNRILTFFQNLCTGAKLSEYHTGYRAFSASVLRNIDYHKNSDSHIFDNQILSKIIMAGFPIGEVSCPTYYDENASSLNFRKSLQYGLGVVWVSVGHLIKRTAVKFSK